MKTPNPTISETTTSGAEIVASIDDLIKSIFVQYLPLKPLIRFKLVSKHWNSIISDPKLHFTRNHNRAVGLIFQNTYREETRVVVSFDRSSNPPHQVNIPNTLQISHSCNGLLVLKSNAAPKYDYYVYNPTTSQKTTPLPKDDKARARETVLGMYLVFDPSKSRHYKVVCVWELGHRWLCQDIMHQYQFEVYSSETRSWEIRCGWFTDYVDFNNGVYWNGAIHWLNLNGKFIFFNPDCDEMPEVMPHPPIHEGSPGYYFGESCGHLHCAVFVGVRNSPEWIYVYEMRRDYSEWFLKFRVDGQCLREKKVRHVFCVVRGERDEEDSFLVLGNADGEIIRYNLGNKTCETIQGKATKHGEAFDFNSTYMMSKSCHQYIVSPCSV